MSSEGVLGKGSAKRTIEVQILGQRLVLRADDDPHGIEHIAAYVKRKTEELAGRGPVSTSKLAVLAALNIAEDYFRAIEDSRKAAEEARRAQDELRALKREVARRSRALLQTLEAEAQRAAAPAGASAVAAGPSTLVSAAARAAEPPRGTIAASAAEYPAPEKTANANDPAEAQHVTVQAVPVSAGAR